jgi:hypothetical protein
MEGSDAHTAADGGGPAGVRRGCRPAGRGEGRRHQGKTARRLVSGQDRRGRPAGRRPYRVRQGRQDEGLPKRDGKDTVVEGTYVLEGDKLSVTLKHEGKEDKHVVTIKKLTDTDMAVETDKGKKAEFKRKK